MLMCIATIPNICFAFKRQVCIAEYCHQPVLRSAETIQRSSWATLDSTAYHSERGRRLSDEIGSELIVEEVFIPYFEDRMHLREDLWKSERVLSLIFVLLDEKSRPRRNFKHS